jgi:hypothetical protein
VLSGPFLILGTDPFWCNHAMGWSGLGNKAMKHDTLWFASPIAWGLVLLAAILFASFA